MSEEIAYDNGFNDGISEERERITNLLKSARKPYPHYKKTPGDRGDMIKSVWLTHEIISIIGA